MHLGEGGRPGPGGRWRPLERSLFQDAAALGPGRPDLKVGRGAGTRGASFSSPASEYRAGRGGSVLAVMTQTITHSSSPCTLLCKYGRGRHAPSRSNAATLSGFDETLIFFFFLSSYILKKKNLISSES